MKKIATFILDKLKKIARFIVDEPKKIATYIIGINGLGQLVISQVHIEALIRVKLSVSTIGASNYTAGMPSNGIGMFMFLYILFGLISIFIVMRAKTVKRDIVALIFLVIPVMIGVVYVLKSTNPDSLVQYEDVKKSMEYIYLSFALYGISAILIIFSIFNRRKLA